MHSLMPKKREGERGFSAVEALVSIALALLLWSGSGRIVAESLT